MLISEKKQVSWKNAPNHPDWNLCCARGSSSPRNFDAFYTFTIKFSKSSPRNFQTFQSGKSLDKILNSKRCSMLPCFRSVPVFGHWTTYFNAIFYYEELQKIKDSESCSVFLTFFAAFASPKTLIYNRAWNIKHSQSSWSWWLAVMTFPAF